MAYQPREFAMRVALDEQLNQAQGILQEQSALVQRMLRASLKALEDADPDLADEVIEYDDRVDELYLHLERLVEEVVALQAPMATTMRLILAISKINLHMERMGDYCVTVAKLTKLSAGLEADERLVEWMEEMGHRAEEMIQVAMEAFMTRDAALAESLIGLDELIDRANRKAVDWVVELASEPSKREWAVRMLIVSRCLERLGDHAVDIGEQTAYLVTGQFREFTDASHNEASATGA